MPSGGSIYIVIAVTFFGFLALAFLLLFPVYRFMKRQEEMADDWTTDAIARRMRERSIPAAPDDAQADETPDA